MSSATCDSDVAANSLYSNLVDETQFTLPVVDLTSPEFLAPSTIDNDLFEDPTKLTEADLTSRTVGGSGMFDAMMASTKAHLKEEFAANRITGKEYTDAYVNLTTASMSTATQYLLQKDNAYWSAVMVQKQAQVAEMEVVKARIMLERAKAELRAQQYDTKTRAAQYAHTKLMIASEDAKRCLTQAQSEQVTYETGFVLPKQVENITAGIAQTTAQTDQVSYQTGTIMPAQLAGIQTETSIKDYQLLNLLPKELETTTAQIADINASTALKTTQGLKVDADILLTGAQKLVVDNEAEIGDYRILNMLPKELEKLTAEVAITTAEELRVDAQTNQISIETTTLLPQQAAKLTAEISMIGKQEDNIDQEILKSAQEVTLLGNQASKVNAEKDQILYQNTAILPAQLLGIQKDTAVKAYQLESVLPAQVAGVTEDTVGKAYTNSYILPEQLENIREQVEANRAKTMDTRTDGITPVTGTMGKQKDLHAQQINSYQRDAESKVVKMLIDTWITGKSMDENYGTPTQITMGSIDSAVSSLRTNLNL